MPRTPEQLIQELIGAQALRIAILTTQLEIAHEHIKDLEERLHKFEHPGNKSETNKL